MTARIFFKLLLAAAIIAVLLWSYGRYRAHLQARDLADRVGRISNEGATLAELGRFEESVLRFRQAQDLAPDDTCLIGGISAVYGNWLATLYQQGDHREVLRIGARARAEGIRNPTVHFCNAMSFYRDGQADSAYALLKEVSLTMPPDEAVSQALSRLELEMGLEKDFESGRSGFFDVRFEGSENREVSDLVLQLLEGIRDRVGGELGHSMQRTTRVVLYSNRQFQDITRLAGWVGAAFDGRIKVPVANYRDDRNLLERVLTHEFTHAAVYDMTGGRVPTWLNEGLAMRFEGIKPETERFIPLSQMINPFTNMTPDRAIEAYNASLSAVSYLTTQYDMAFVRMLLTKLREGKDFEPAFYAVYGMTVGEFEQRWRENLLKRGR